MKTSMSVFRVNVSQQLAMIMFLYLSVDVTLNWTDIAQHCEGLTSLSYLNFCVFILQVLAISIPAVYLFIE